METFGERMKKMRREADMGVAELAAVIGVTPDSVMKIESGKRGRAFDRLPKIAKAFGCRIDDLFPEMDEPEGKTVCADGFDNGEMEGWEE